MLHLPRQRRRARSGDRRSDLEELHRSPEAPQQVGKNSKGTTLYGPAGAAVWNSPTIDTQKGVLYIGTGNSYTGPAVKTSDSVIAMDLKTGKIALVEPGDRRRRVPRRLPPGHRELPEGARTGLRLRQRADPAHAARRQADHRHRPEVRASCGGSIRTTKARWCGSSRPARAARSAASNGARRPTTRPPTFRCRTCWRAPNEAGGLFALKLADGEKIWNTPAPKLECNTGRGCTGAQSAPVSVIPGVVFSGSVDGHMRAYSTTDGSIIWDFNTVARVRDGEPRAGKGRIDRCGRPGDRRRTARHQLGLRAVARAARATCCWRSRRNDRMAEPKVRVDAVMGEIERDVRARLRRHLLKQGGAAEYRTRRSSTRCARCSPARSTSATSTRRCCRSCSTATSTGGCRPTSRSPRIVPAVGRFILFAKRQDAAAADALAVRVQPGQLPPPGSPQPGAVRLHRGTRARERPPSPRSTARAPGGRPARATTRPRLGAREPRPR